MFYFLSAEKKLLLKVKFLSKFSRSKNFFCSVSALPLHQNWQLFDILILSLIYHLLFKF